MLRVLLTLLLLVALAPAAISPCEDHSPRCALWVSHDMCNGPMNQQMTPCEMANYCAASCNLCDLNC